MRLMIQFKRATVTAAGTLALLGSPSVAWAQEDSQSDAAAPAQALTSVIEEGRQVYPKEQFARFAPQSALDMVRQIPGFTISRLSGDRGLGDGSQNVLIDGQRITGKSNDAETALTAIPVALVVRLEVGDASAYKVSGLNGQVVNVVTSSGRLSGSIIWRPEFGNGANPVLTFGEVNLAGQLASGKFSVSLTNLRATRELREGTELTSDPTGQIINQRGLTNRSRTDRPRIAGTFGKSWGNGDILNANAALEFFESRRSRGFDQQSSAVFPVLELITNREDEWNIELGADYETAVAKGRLKLIAFHRFEHSPFVDMAQRQFANGTASAERFEQVIDEGETVMRGEYRWDDFGAKWQVSAEAAYNVLDVRSDLFEAANGSAFQPIPIVNATSRVSEKRGQATLVYSRELGSAVSLQTLMGAEVSRLSQSGDAGLSRQFLRPKGSISLSWRASPRLTISTRLQRKVGQLFFGDFVAFVDVQNNNNNAGNPSLVPPQSWQLEIEAKQLLGDFGSINTRLEAESISDFVDQIPVSASEEAPGNVQGKSNRLRAEVNGTVLFDRLGIPGGKLDFAMALQSGRLIDPITRRNRTFSGLDKSSWKFDFRQDVPNSPWAWGGLVEDSRIAPFYRLGFVSNSRRSVPLASAFIENKDVAGLKVRLSLLNILGADVLDSEIFYDERRDGPISAIRQREAATALGYRLQLSRSF